MVEDFGSQVKWLWAAQLQGAPFMPQSVVGYEACTLYSLMVRLHWNGIERAGGAWQEPAAGALVHLYLPLHTPLLSSLLPPLPFQQFPPPPESLPNV